MVYNEFATMKRVSNFVKKFLETDLDSMLISDEAIVGTPFRFRTFINHSISNYDIKGVKAVVRKGHVYVIRDSNMA